MNADKYPHLVPAVDRLRRLPVSEPPAPWRAVLAHAVGGLRAVGFDPASGLLLVTSSNGRGVLDCYTGIKLARDYEELGDWLDEQALEAEGIGPLAGIRVRLSGLCGGGLSQVAHDGWLADVLPFDWPDECSVLSAPGSDPLDTRLEREQRLWKVADPICEVRAFGFSPDGRVLLLATSADITAWVRPA